MTREAASTYGLRRPERSERTPPSSEPAITAITMATVPVKSTPASPAEAFAQILDLAEHNTRRPGRTKMFNVLAAEAGDPGHPAHPFFVRRYAAVVGHVAGALEHAKAAGGLKQDTDCVGVAEELAAVMDGLQLQWALNPGHYDMTTRLRRYLDRTLRSLTGDGSGLNAK
ncbi:TetR family transcriptional regulator C-terminal domain-containing protein [Streptomyces sp. NPDC087300]|uniref:TetR family transcriptional regulator C-terminal domain-containing protein n=1 Tax=Streptomyces sp. NPDC087300 TaxID=3365780 RepID=UPI00381386F2